MNLEEEYIKLESEYTELLDKYTSLLSDYSENTIIQSMNDMKARYDELISTTVPIYKYNQMLEKCKELENNKQAGIVLLQHIIKGLVDCESSRLLNSERVKRLQKAQIGLTLLKEIFADQE
jgi:hypothetical protein